jgi:hypothetical protein
MWKAEQPSSRKSGTSLRNDPPWWDSHGFESPAPHSLGRHMRGARPRPLRVVSARGPTTASGDRACPRLGARRGQDDGSSRSGRPRDGRGQRHHGAARHAACAAGQAGVVAQLPRTSLARPPMRLWPHVLLHMKTRARLQSDSSANRSVINCRRLFTSSCLMTRGCGTTSVGRCLSAERASWREP